MGVSPKATPISHFTPPPALIFTIFFFLLHPVYPLDITQILSHYPDLSQFTSLLTASEISDDINHRDAVTILAVPNAYLRPTSPSSSTTLADAIRYHVLLQYLTWSDLRGSHLITTLLQTTGRAPDTLGSLNFTSDPSNGVVSFHPANNSSASSNVISLLKTVPYSLSIFTVDSLLEPSGYDLTASELRPSPPSINITDALINGHDFNVAASMLTASGVVSEFQQDEDGAGITFFVPTDVAFANLPPSVQLQALPAERKSLVLKFHVLHSYYPLGSLESIVNPAQPTLATEDNGAGSFTLNISRVNGSVSLNTGLVQAVVTQTVFDQKPVAIFGVSNVLLPKEIFGKGSEVDLRGGGGRGGGGGGGPFVAQPPDIGTVPESSPDIHFGGPSSSPPVSGGGGGGGNGGWAVMLSCIAGLFLCVV